MEKEPAGEALLDAIADVSETEPVELGSYRGFTVAAKLAMFGEHKIMLKGAVTYTVELGDSAGGNIIRIDNALAKLPEHLEDNKAKLADLHRQMESARAEAAKSFALDARASAEIRPSGGAGRGPEPERKGWAGAARRVTRGLGFNRSGGAAPQRNIRTIKSAVRIPSCCALANFYEEVSPWGSSLRYSHHS